DQPQLQGPLRPRQALARLTAHRRCLRLHRPHHGLPSGDVPGDEGPGAGAVAGLKFKRASIQFRGTSTTQPLASPVVPFPGRQEVAMHQEYKAVIKEDAGWWIGWIEEIPGVNCQEATREELIESLRVTLKEALILNRQEAVAALVVA